MELLPIQTTQIGLAITNCYSMQYCLINSPLDNDDLIIHVLNGLGPSHCSKKLSLLLEQEILPSHLRNSMTNFWTMNPFLNMK
ncbi:hypothetical protein ACOSQ3_021636 [Xanthoceras sorbifolium]